MIIVLILNYYISKIYCELYNDDLLVINVLIIDDLYNDDVCYCILY